MWLIGDEKNEEITDKQGILNTLQKYVEELQYMRQEIDQLSWIQKIKQTYQKMKKNFQFLWKKLNQR